jgi:hypothetical protein
MFLARSAFWLTVAYLVIGPGTFDLEGTADRLSAQAAEAGRTLVANQLLGGHCLPFQCPGGSAGTIVPSVDGAPAAPSSPVPLPRPRPDRMG